MSRYKERRNDRRSKTRATPAKKPWPLPRHTVTILGFLALVTLTIWGTSHVIARWSVPVGLTKLMTEAPDPVTMSPALALAVTQAQELLRQEIQSSEGDAKVGQAIGRLAQLYQANDYNDFAAPAYELAIQLDGIEPRWPYLLASLRQERGESQSVTGLLTTTVALAPDYTPAWLKLADNQFKQGDRSASRTSYEQLLTLAPNDSYGHLGLARLALAENNWERAQWHLEQSVSHGGFDAAYRLLASVHEHFNQPQAMEAALAGADTASRFASAPDQWVDELLLQSFDVDWLLMNVSRFAYVGSGEMARAIFTRAQQLDPDNPEVYIVLGESSESPADIQRAFRTAISLEPEHARAHALLGEAVLRYGNPAEAEPILRKALDLGADPATTYKNLGLAVARTGRFDEAIVHLKRAVTLSPEIVAFHYSLATILRAAGLTDEAILEYRHVLERQPSHGQAAKDLQDLTGQ